MIHTIDLQGGASLILHTFEPAAAPLAVVVVPSAMGVTQNFYARFAEWLAERGYLAATFDYRGIGQSAPRARVCAAHMRRCARRCCRCRSPMTK